MASLTQLVSQTANSTVEQNSGVLDTVSNYFGELAIFVNTSNVTINVTVSVIDSYTIYCCFINCHFNTWCPVID